MTIASGRDLNIGDIAAQLGISLRVAQQRAKEDGWPYRIGTGTGRPKVYDLDTLPASVRSQIEARAAIEAAKVDTSRQIAMVETSNLTARQRAVMEARAALLLDIDRRVLIEGSSVTAAVRGLAADSAAGRLDPALAAACAVANDRSGGKAVVKERILFAWRAAKAAGGVPALAPIPTKTAQDMPGWFRDFLPRYAKPTKPKVARVLAEWQRAEPGRDLPSYQQVRRVLDKLGAIDKMRGREGAQALKARQAYTARDASDLLPTSVYVADGKTFDAEIAHPFHGRPFRPELTTIIDAHTRRIVGFSAALDESAVAVTDALRVACMGSGIPAIFYTDRGSGYVNDTMDASLTGLLGRLGITPMRALPYNSQAKGIVERLNHEWSHLARDYDTYISRDMDREAKKTAHHATRREIAVAGTSRLLPRWPDFISACMRAIEIYNARPHRTLAWTVDAITGKRRHMTPDEAWQAGLERGFEPITVSAEEANDLFRPWTTRKVSRCEIEIFTNTYFALELEPFHGDEVIVAYDLQDATRIWVREIGLNADGERVPGKLIAVAQFEGNKTRYVPVSAEQAAMEKRAASRERRLMGHVETVREELRPTLLLESQTPIDHLSKLHPLAQDDREIVAMPVTVPTNGRPTFIDDVQYARWLVANPGAVTSADIAFVRDELLGSTAARDELRIAGIDLDTLRDVAQRAA
ncbi:Mu transposase C-terminal domain-containing protein [Ancylobacter sp. A5.8]|uniref:Mu transposase C-terminal domain-containing protein n=1 Tax=Ancylobacter gelatini TaxID=2919920 RepID=UPI001F4E6618|nr:Mu transposase C-terminal domain-containing protein [Ancylobacter gelatini]MCJ8142931.1 Mu transposase C-terminal domain-containing protein [Ancylobacter gelatini]